MKQSIVPIGIVIRDSDSLLVIISIRILNESLKSFRVILLRRPEKLRNQIDSKYLGIQESSKLQMADPYLPLAPT